MRYVVEVALDVYIYTPAVIVGMLAAFIKCLVGIFTTTVRITACMKVRFKVRFKHPSQHFLYNAVAYRWDAQRTYATTGFGYQYPPYRFRKISPANKPLPDDVQVVVTLSVKRLPALLVGSISAIVQAYMLVRFPYLSFLNR
jgi:hypothetical protein